MQDSSVFDIIGLKLPVRVSTFDEITLTLDEALSSELLMENADFVMFEVVTQDRVRLHVIQGSISGAGFILRLD